MTKAEITKTLEVIGLEPDLWLKNLRLNELIGVIVVDSGYHIQIDKLLDYRFNNETEVLEIGNTNGTTPKVMKIIPYENIRAFNGTYIIHRGVPYMKDFR